MSLSQKKKVFVGMSGGVDSSVAAALLKRQGYEVTGAFIKIWLPELSACDWRAERRDAMRAAAALKIPFLTFDLSREYRQSVIDYLFKEYRAGRTPNPDVMCNKEIKFGELFRRARALGADYLATGHYVQLRRGATRFRLMTARDKTKDQTYFLWTIKQEILKHCLFPIGQYQKSAVRALAKKFGLPNAAKPDSQGLCFIGQINFKDFLHQYLPKTPGPVLDEAGQVIGEHRGSHFYTIGERHGFEIRQRRISSAEKADTSPYYIMAKNPSRNILIAVPRQRAADWAIEEIELTRTNWISVRPIAGKIYSARTRYRAPLASCRLAPSNGDRWNLVFEKPQTSIAPGQSCVFYNSLGTVCLGGGVIE